jgi:hypothetical protein
MKVGKNRSWYNVERQRPTSCQRKPRKGPHKISKTPTMSSSFARIPHFRCSPPHLTHHSSDRTRTTVVAIPALCQRCEHPARMLSQRAMGMCYGARLNHAFD